MPAAGCHGQTQPPRKPSALYPWYTRENFFQNNFKKLYKKQQFSPICGLRMQRASPTRTSRVRTKTLHRSSLPGPPAPVANGGIPYRKSKKGHRAKHGAPKETRGLKGPQLRCQISSLYCRIVRSEEKYPALAMLTSILPAQASRPAYCRTAWSLTAIYSSRSKIGRAHV